MTDLIQIESINLKKKIKENNYYFKQIQEDEYSKIIITTNEPGYISFYTKSKNKLKINNKNVSNGYVNLKVVNKISIECTNKNNNIIVIKNINLFTMNEYNSFKYDIYKNNYDDLKHITNNHILWCHWCQFGKKEGRINNESIKNQNQLEKDFDWKQYIDNYKDLRDAGISTEKSATEHWIHNGKKEGRTYYKLNENQLENDFDWKQYIDNYKDLRDAGILTEKSAIEHWIHNGKKEGRTYYKLNENQLEKDFDWKQYIDNYKDLRDAGILTEKSATEHWIHNGKKENRHYYRFDINYFKKVYVNDIFNKKLKLKNITIIKSDNEMNSLDESNVLITKHYNRLNFNPEKIDIEYIDYIDNFILIVDFFNGGGGTTQFINHIVSNYKMNKIFLIVRNYSNKIIFTINDEYEINTGFNDSGAINFLKKNVNKIEKIFVNHTLGHSIDFLNELIKLNVKKTLITHDYYLINNIPNPFIHNIKESYTNKNRLNINVFDKIITQNKKNLYILNTHIKNKNIPIIISDLPDYKETLNLINTSNDKIIIGIFGAISDIKGLMILNDIVNKYKDNNNIEIVVFGLCNIKDFKNYHIYHSIQELNELLIKFKPNILIELSIWPETYSYTLTLKMITKLPIIYFKKTGNFVVEDRLSKYDKAYPFETLEEFDKLIKLHKQNYLYTIKPVIYFNNFWDKYFGKLKTEKINQIITHKKNINIYPIYFPQFHPIRENNISFYEGYTDIENLNLLSKSIKTETPDLNSFKLNSITDYNLTNIKIIQKQIDLLTDYNLSGFAMYYYWFSTNTITNNNMVMEKVVNIFFTDDVDLGNKKIFFIWANESWSGNPAFGNGTHKIENDYGITNINKNVNNLMKYFKHKNYLKINNKPLLLIYHEWFMTHEELKLFEKTINDKCLENNFNGINLVINSMNNPNIKDFKTFYLNFNYKKSPSSFIKNNQIYLDYKKYIDAYDNKEKNKIQTVVFDFDNRARLYKPDKLKLSTICINNNLFNKILFMKKIFDNYEKSNENKLNDIVLFNAWNEWGEKMILEPSEQSGFFNLNILSSFMLNYYKKH